MGGAAVGEEGEQVWAGKRDADQRGGECRSHLWSMVFWRGGKEGRASGLERVFMWMFSGRTSLQLRRRAHR